VSAGALRDQDAAVKTRGPAPAEVAAKVKRCANQLGLTDVLAGDAGIWRGQAATIVITRLGARQATGQRPVGAAGGPPGQGRAGEPVAHRHAEHRRPRQPDGQPEGHRDRDDQRFDVPGAVTAQ
jgi:hypothetical protein